MQPSQAHPRVAVAMTTKNAAPTIGYSLESLLAQRGARLSVVIVDSHSSDGTVDIARDVLERSGVEYRVVKRECNIAEGRNISLREALNYDPDYILFFDADVLLRYNNLVHLASTISRGRLVAIISYRDIFLSYEDFDDFLGRVVNGSKVNSIDREGLVVSKVKWGGLGATLIPRRLAEEIEFDPDLSFGEDRQLGLMAWARGYPVVEMREHGDPLAYDVNLSGPGSDIYTGMPLREYLRGITKKVFIHEVWHNFEGDLAKTIKKLVTSRQFKRYAFHALYDLAAAALLVYTILNPQPTTYLALTTWISGIPLIWARRGKYKEAPLAKSLRNFVKFNLFSASVLTLFLYSYYKNKDILLKAYKNYRETNIPTLISHAEH